MENPNQNDTSEIETNFEVFADSTQIEDSLKSLLRAAPEPFHETTNKVMPNVPEIRFYVHGTQENIAFKAKGIITLGRKDAPNKIFPSIDLNDYDGADLGVSRRHASVNFHQGRFHVMDLGSSNGTWLNEKKLLPRQMTPIYDGDVLSLGKLKLFIAI